MTHCEACRAAQSGARPGRSFILRLLRSWLSSRRLAKLSDLDGRLLRDIGLRREELDCALNRPLSVNGSEELRRIILHRTA
jgi:uncharacterized protein YjiS (DUF1127 family)